MPEKPPRRQAKLQHAIQRWIILSAQSSTYVATFEVNRITRGPLADLGIVVSQPESDEAGVRVAKASRIAERLEPRIRIREHTSELVVVDDLRERSVPRIDGKPDAASLVRHDAEHAKLEPS